MGGEYFVGVISAVVVGSAAELLPPEGEGGEAKVFRFVVSLLVLCVIALPLLDGLTEVPLSLSKQLDDLLARAGELSSDANVYAAEAAAYIRTASAEAAAEEIALLLAERFGVPIHCVRAEVTLGEDAEGMTVPLDIKVFFSGKAVFQNPYIVEEYLTALFGGICSVVIE